MTAGRLLFVRQKGFPRRWLAIRRLGRDHVGVITQEHARDGGGKSLFRYRVALLPDRDLGLVATLRLAKQALTDALDA
jgi:hypothetical protein